MKYFPAALTREESDALIDRIEAEFESNGFGFWAVEVVGVAGFIGFVGLSVTRFEAHFTPSVDIGWRIAAEHWNNGFATEAARATLRFAFDSLQLDEVVSLAVWNNWPSRRVMEKIGMTHNAGDDFDHPDLPGGHPFRRHVLYRIVRGKVPAREC